MKDIAASLLLALLLAGGGFSVGALWQQGVQLDRAQKAGELARQASARAAAQAAADAQAERAVLAEQLRTLSRHGTTLQERLTDATRLTTTPRCTLAAAVRAAPASGPAGLAVATPDLAAGSGPGLRVGLSGLAVSLWNSALAGVDVPAGACRPDDPASAACTADSGVSLVQAWRNQAANATSCAEDRARYTRLIGYLQRREHASAPLSHTP